MIKNCLENKNLIDVSERQKHLTCVSTVVRIMYDLETLIYVSETHNYKGAKENIKETQNSLLFMFFETLTFF